MCLWPNVAASYACLPAGYYVEPETHKFLDRVISSMPQSIRFIDVGANVGAMVVHVAGLPQVQSCIAFEPISDCVQALKIAVLLNSYRHVEILEKALGADPGVGHLYVNVQSQTASYVCIDDQLPPPNVEVSTLDIELAPCHMPSICLIDVEGAEHDVIRGGRKFINHESPLLVFEYNEVSRARFALEDIRNALPETYTLRRLRSDGYLDDDLSDTWNCCAIPRGPMFENICDQLTRK